MNIRLASSQCSKLMFVGERANGACLGVGGAEDGSLTQSPLSGRQNISPGEASISERTPGRERKEMRTPQTCGVTEEFCLEMHGS